MIVIHVFRSPQAQRLKAYSNNGQQLLCMPGRLRLSLTYWQAPVHGLEVSVTTSVTLPSFIDQQKNKARGKCWKLVIFFNIKKKTVFSRLYMHLLSEEGHWHVTRYVNIWHFWSDYMLLFE